MQFSWPLPCNRIRQDPDAFSLLKSLPGSNKKSSLADFISGLLMANCNKTKRASEMRGFRYMPAGFGVTDVECGLQMSPLEVYGAKPTPLLLQH